MEVLRKYSDRGPLSPCFLLSQPPLHSPVRGSLGTLLFSSLVVLVPFPSVFDGPQHRTLSKSGSGSSQCSKDLVKANHQPVPLSPGDSKTPGGEGRAGTGPGAGLAPHRVVGGIKGKDPTEGSAQVWHPRK